MKIKIPNYGDLNLREYHYFITGEKILVCDKDTRQFKHNKKGDILLLPSKYHINLLSVKIQQEKIDTGLWILTK